MDAIAKIKQDKPFIFNITNEVASNFSANGLIAIGASPAMSHTPREAKKYGEIADAVVLNLGTLTEDRGEAMLKAGMAANKNGVPVILDPIAVGGTDFRTEIIDDILKTVKLAAIRANAGEIAVLAGKLEKAKGPDSIIQENDPEIAKTVAKKYDTVVISTGKVDVVTDGKRTALCTNGHEMLQNITASGCLLSSFVGPFVSVIDDFYQAGIYAVTSYGIAAELAMEKASGPGTFIPALLDELYFLTDEKVEKYKQVHEL